MTIQTLITKWERRLVTEEAVERNTSDAFYKYVSRAEQKNIRDILDDLRTLHQLSETPTPPKG
ncbi:MAG: hypothetical protein ABQ298_03795 [Puniceicoccaceae bacterium]